MSIDISSAGRAAGRDATEKALSISALVLIVLGVKLLFVAHFCSPVPYWDQWDGEADILYKSYLGSNLSWATMLGPHNEHRILLTRLLSLGLFEVKGGWDPILQMMINAVLHVVAIVLIVLRLARLLRPVQWLPLAMFSAFLFVLPIGFENLMAGFQSQFYFLLIFSIVALGGFSGASAFSLGWFASLACALAAFYSMASGALIGLAAFCIVALQMLTGVRKGAREYLAAALLLGMSAVMIVHVPHLDGHEALKAHSIWEFLTALRKCLDFPGHVPFIGMAIHLPLVVYTCVVLASRPARTSPHWVVVSLVVWWLGQLVSISYGRAAGPDAPRYLDLTIVALPINFAVLLYAFNRVDERRQRWLWPLTASWLAIVICGLVLHTARLAMPGVIEKAGQAREQEANVAAYLKSGDLATLQNKPFLAIPYPSPERLGLLLSDPVIRMALPDAIKPADVAEQSRFDRTYLRGRFHSVVARVKLLLLAWAPALLGLGVALAFAAGLATRTQTRAAGSGSYE